MPLHKHQVDPCEFECASAIGPLENECDCISDPLPSLLGCQPICERNCTNGKCIGPNQCECMHGYRHVDNDNNDNNASDWNVCHPICNDDGNCTECYGSAVCHSNGSTQSMEPVENYRMSTNSIAFNETESASHR